jgi:hypothetical protein
MAEYKAVVTKDGKIIPFPNPERQWDGAAHNDWTNYLISKGIPGNQVEALWNHLRQGRIGRTTPAPNGLAYFTSPDSAKRYSQSRLNPTPPAPPRPDTKSFPEKVDDFRAQLARLEQREFQNISESEKTNLSKAASAVTTASPKNFSEAVNNYTTALAVARTKGIENLEVSDRTNLSKFARQVRDFDTPQLGQGAKAILENIKDVEDAITAVKSQRDLIERQKERVKELSGKEQETARAKLYTEQDALARIIATANSTAPKIDEALSRVGLQDILSGITTPDKRIAEVETGLQAFSGDRVFGTGALAAKLNSQITDAQILNDVNTARKNEYKRLADLGSATITDLTATIESAKQQLPAVAPNQRATAQKQIADLEKQLSEVRADTVQAQNLFQNYKPISGAEATKAISGVREQIRLPEQRALDQIMEIDPSLLGTIGELGKQYRTLATTPIGATTAESTEALRRQTEGQVAAQVALGSRLGAEEQRQYQQAARAAQTARGNVFGVAPAVEEAVTTGAAGEQRLAARLGAAQGFLSSGQTVSDALARDVSLRNALQQSRLGAATEFMAGGPTAYNLANQRTAQQRAAIQQYVGSTTPQQAGGFTATPTQMTPYAYVNPQAGFLGAQNAANVYGSLTGLQASNYAAQVGAISRQPSGAQIFGEIAGGLSNLISI